jgi:hypothetical protein
MAKDRLVKTREMIENNLKIVASTPSKDSCQGKKVKSEQR